MYLIVIRGMYRSHITDVVQPLFIMLFFLGILDCVANVLWNLTIGFCVDLLCVEGFECIKCNDIAMQPYFCVIKSANVKVLCKHNMLEKLNNFAVPFRKLWINPIRKTCG